MTVSMPERLAFRGGAVKGHLIAPVAPDDLIVSCDALIDWPTGSDGRFQAVIGRTLPNEEKVLVAIRSGAILTIAQRGWDGTQAVSHAATETVEHVHTAHDADEANSHTSKVYGHGVASDESIVGTRKAQALRNKTIDGSLNTLQNIPAAASPEIADLIDAVETSVSTEATARANADSAEATARANGDAAEATARADADAAHLAALDPHPQYATPAEMLATHYTKAEVDALFPDDPAVVADSGNGVFTGTTPSPTQGSLTALAVTYRVPPSGKVRVDIGGVLRVSVGAGVGHAVHIGYEMRQTNSSGTILSAAASDRAGLTETAEAVQSMSSITHVGLTPGSIIYVRVLHWVSDAGITGAIRLRRLAVVGFW